MSAAEWNALNETGLCSSSSAHRRFQEWEAAGVFHRLWELGLHEYDELKGLEWEWQALDGAMTKAPLGGKETGPNPTDRAKRGAKRSLLTEGGVSRSGSRWREPTGTTSRWRGRRWKASR
jgi:putative transposase